jgi:hypothetical protein
MDIIWLAVAVSILGGGSGPETRVVTQGVYSEKDCNSWKKALSELPPKAVDDVTGRSLLSKTYVCTPVDPKWLQTSLDKLK